jgi:hypothetical protein
MTTPSLFTRPGARWRAAAAALAAVVLLAGCSGRRQPAAPPASAAPATTSQPPPVWPLTGLPVRDPARANRPPLSIKIDNVAKARPQAGLNDADLVSEELVEGGLTRLLATFHSRDAAQVGPVRSVRPVDGPLLRELGGGLFGFSGGAAGVLDRVRKSSGATFLGPGQAPAAYRRVGGRPAPHNQFTSTAALYQAGSRVAPAQRPPRAFLTFAAGPPAGGRRAGGVRLRFSPSAAAAWRWDGQGRHWLRSQDGSADRLVGGQQVSADNVVVLRVRIRADQNRDVLGNPTPDAVVVGGGAAWVLRDGRLLTGSWRRAADDQPVRLLGPGGAAIALHPGRTWIELLPSSQRPAFG